MSTPLHLVRDGKRTPIPLDGFGYSIRTGQIEKDGVCITATHNETESLHYAFVTEQSGGHVGADTTLAPGESVELKFIPGGALVEHEAEAL